MPMRRGFMKKKVLLIDDDSEMSELLSEYLDRYNIELLAAGDAQKGMRLLRQENPDCVLLDVMLPGKDGFLVCADIRRESHVPVIMLTARGELADRIVGLELGADGYMPKPFEPRELAARIQSLIRRATLSDGNLLQYGEIELDLKHRMATRKGVKLPLTTMEFDMFFIFVSHVGVVLSRETLVEHLHKINWESSAQSVGVTVSRLRRKLGDDPHNPLLLKTVHKSGYVLTKANHDAEPL
jgi:DNA-binding response OmpR family regulator